MGFAEDFCRPILVWISTNMAIFVEIQSSIGRQNYSAKPITVAHDEILTNGFLRLNRETL
jgi:hypothetical protein